MQHLPTTTEQDWLVARLAELIAFGGKAQFLDWPVVEPTAKFFPDRWDFSHRGLDRLVRRLMQYADLGGLDVEIGTFVDLQGRGRTAAHQGGQSTAALFMGIENGCCLFGFNRQAPADAEYMAGVMCHEVAHAYRAHHGLVDLTIVQEEELITDITTVYLGFGLLSANNSFRYRTYGGYGYRSWSLQSTGYLPPQAFAFLLANQLVARDLSAGERGRLFAHLEADQAGFTESALAVVRDRQVEIMRILGLNPAERRDAPKRIDDILRPLPDYVVREAPPGPSSESTQFNRGRPVFRVAKDHFHYFGCLGLVLGALIGLIGALVFERTLIIAGGAFAGVAIGMHRGRRARFDLCSEAQCRAVLSSADTCPNCGGMIVGTIKDENDRLEAEDQWRERRMTKTNGRTVAPPRERGAR